MPYSTKPPFIFDVPAQVFLDCSSPLQSCSVPLAMDIVPHNFATVFPWHWCFSDENGEVALITESPPRMYIGDPYLHSISQWRNCALTLLPIKAGSKGNEIAVHYLSCKYCMLPFEPLLIESHDESHDQTRHIFLQLWDTQTFEMKEEKKLNKNQDCRDAVPLKLEIKHMFLILCKGNCFAFSDI